MRGELLDLGLDYTPNLHYWSQLVEILRVIVFEVTTHVLIATIVV
jgi:hypothetical protein